MHVIFLDIDGVICCNNFSRLEEDKLMNLKRLVDQTSAKIVLSTDWRKFKDAKRVLIATLRGMGMKVIGQTPTHSPWARPKEITAWLTNFNSRAKRDNTQAVDSWVAIDDRLLLQEPGGQELRRHFVRTIPARGLTMEAAERCEV